MSVVTKSSEGVILSRVVHNPTPSTIKEEIDISLRLYFSEFFKKTDIDQIIKNSIEGKEHNGYIIIDDRIGYGKRIMKRDLGYFVNGDLKLDVDIIYEGKAQTTPNVNRVENVSKPISEQSKLINEIKNFNFSKLRKS